MPGFRTMILLSTLLVSATAHAAESHAYRITQMVPLGEPDRWDYVFFDAASARVYVAHADRVSVVDGKTGAPIGEIAGIPGGTHGIAFAKDGTRGYTDDGEAGAAIPFDPATLKPAAPLPAGEDDDAMAADPASGHIFVMNGDSGKVTVIDPAQNAVIGTVELGGKLEAAVADGKGRLYINGAGKREIIRLNTASLKVEARFPVPDCESPHGMALDRERGRIFTSCVNEQLVVVDADQGGVIATLPIGKGTDAAAYDPKRRRIFSSNGRDGTLTVIQAADGDRYTVLDTVPTAITGRTMDIDPATGRLFIAAAALDPDSVAAGGRPKIQPGSLKLLFLDPES
jgi:YVTN family beta-propeller protein